MFHAVNEALDSVSEAIYDFIKRACPGFIYPPRDGEPDMMVRKVLAHGTTAICLVSDQSVRPDSGAASSLTLYRAGLHEAIKRSRFMPLSWGKRKGDQLAVSICSQMNLGGVPALAVPECFAFLPLFFRPEAC